MSPIGTNGTSPHVRLMVAIGCIAGLLKSAANFVVHHCELVNKEISLAHSSRRRLADVYPSGSPVALCSDGRHTPRTEM
jgi:hypothetical protein